MPPHLFFPQHFDGEHGYQAYQRPHTKLVKLAVRVTQNVVEKSILFVPQLIVAPAHLLHGGADVDVMLEKLRS